MAILTDRLELVPATPEFLCAALQEETSFAWSLDARLPAGWPPEFHDRAALEYTIERLQQGPEQAGWWMYYFVLRQVPSAGGRMVIGNGGYKGPPTEDGTVEVGYSVVAEYQRQGFATEAVRGLLARAFAVPEVRRIIAETLPELVPSIKVLEKAGFRFVGEGSEAGVLRYELRRYE